MKDVAGTNKKDVLALFIAILTIHMYIISLAMGSLVLLVLCLIDSLIAVTLGFGTNSNYGHGAKIIGILFFIIAISTLLVV